MISFRRAWFAFLAIAFVAASAAAQTRTGSIDGTVRDATGQVLPGVGVTLSGATLVTAQVTASNEVGIYRFLALPPGTYSVRFELSGFKTQLNEGVRVDIGANTAINVTLELSTVEEVVTVVGESPMVDTKSTVIGASFDSKLLEEVPSARDVWSLLEHQAPGVTTNRLDVGGSETGLQALYSARGTSWQQNSYYLNGVNVTCPAALGASGYYYDYDSFEEVQVETGSHPAKVNAAGVYLNMVTKTGGSEFAGGGSFFYQSKGTQANNLDDALRARGATSAAFDYLSDANVQLGGPIVSDKSTFFGSYRNERVHRFVPGFPAGCDPDNPSTCVTENTDMWQFLVKNTTQLNAKNRIGAEWHHMSYYKPHRGAAANRTPDATWIEDDTFDIVQADWTSTLSENALLDARFSHLRVFFPTFQQPDATLQAAQDVGLNRFFNARDFNTERLRKRFAYKADLTYFKEQWAGGNHEFGFGAEYNHSPIRNTNTAIDDVFLIFRNGVSDQVYFRNTPFNDAQAVDQLSFYVDDIVTMGTKLTLKLGLRFDKYTGYLPEQTSPGGTFVPERSFSKVSGLLDVASFAPRLGLVYNVRQGTALKASWGRYYNQFTTGFPNYANKNGSLFDTWTWTDTNGDGQFQQGEQGRQLGSQVASGNTIDPNFKHPYTDEFTLGLETEISKDTSLSFTFSNRHGRLLNDAVDLANPFSSFTPLTVTDPGPDGRLGTADDGGQVTVYNQTTVGSNQFQLTNPEVVDPATGQTIKNQSNFKGFEVILSKRYRNNWTGLVSYSYNDTDTITRGSDGEGDVANNFFINPNQLVNAQGKSFYDRKHQFKFIGSYHAPYGLRISGVLRAQSGTPVARTFTVSGLNQGTVTILAEPVGVERLPNVATADLQFSKDFTFGKTGRISPEVHMFNIFNANTVTSTNTASGANYNTVLNFLSPRIFRFGVRINF
jgi:outer membrane receptor protein involved in Fe transport